MKIYGESIRPDLPYKTLLLSTLDNASYVVKETLDKYGMEKEDPEDYCLIQVTIVTYEVINIVEILEVRIINRFQ